MFVWQGHGDRPWKTERHRGKTERHRGKTKRHVFMSIDGNRPMDTLILSKLTAYGQFFTVFSIPSHEHCLCTRQASVQRCQV